uniref:Cathepsin propeptide inhibitor domain-containing protein n=1 Tax=Ditylenchus dipsaci TaxID=166011 RepID=A0A915DYT0_9BILA
MVVANLVLVVIFWFGVPASSTGDSRLEEGLMHLEPDLLAVFCRYIAHEWKVVRDANSQDSDHTATEFANLETVQHSTQMLDGLKHLTQQNYQDWEAYKELYEKSYNDENEEIVHMLNFLSAQQEVRQHNDAYARKEVTYKQEINYFADLTFYEYQKWLGFGRIHENVDVRNAPCFLPSRNVNVLESFSKKPNSQFVHSHQKT